MCKRLFKAFKIKMDNFKLRYELAGADETIETLRKQVAEKDKEIVLLEEQDGVYHNQLAIEQLELVKEIMSKSDESGYIIRFSTMNDREKFNEIIDNQIKQLKEIENGR